MHPSIADTSDNREREREREKLKPFSFIILKQYYPIVP